MKQIITWLIFSLFLSCSPNFYSPNQQNVPGFEKKGEIKYNGSIYLDPFFLKLWGGDLQYAKSISHKSAFLVNGALYFSNNSRTYYTGFLNGSIYLPGGRGQGAEIGYGQFKKVNKSIIMEMYSFGGLGSFYNNTEDFNGRFKGKFTRLSIQPSTTFKNEKFDLALSFRMSHLYYFDIDGQYENYNKLLKNHPNYFFIEPAITMRYGSNNFKLHTQLVYSGLINDGYRKNDLFKYYDIHIPFNLSIGLKINLNTGLNK
jgi:hypothetical protein